MAVFQGLSISVTAGMLYLTLRSWLLIYLMCTTEMFLIATGPQNRNSDEFARAEPKFDPRFKHTCSIIIVCAVWS